MKNQRVLFYINVNTGLNNAIHFRTTFPYFWTIFYNKRFATNVITDKRQIMIRLDFSGQVKVVMF